VVLRWNLLQLLPDLKGSSRSGPGRNEFKWSAHKDEPSFAFFLTQKAVQGQVHGGGYLWLQSAHITTKHIIGSQGGQQGNLNLLFIELKVIINMSATVTHNYATVFYIICAITVQYTRKKLPVFNIK
jgi:hypothetical protein